MSDLQGSALQSLQTFFQKLVQTKAKSASFDALLAALLAAGHDSQVGKTAQHNIAQCIAGLCTTAGANATTTTVNSLLSAVQGNDATASRLALYSVGEIGRCTDLTKFKQLQVSLFCDTLRASSVCIFTIFICNAVPITSFCSMLLCSFLLSVFSLHRCITAHLTRRNPEPLTLLLQLEEMPIRGHKLHCPAVPAKLRNTFSKSRDRFRAYMQLCYDAQQKLACQYAWQGHILAYNLLLLCICRKCSLPLWTPRQKMSKRQHHRLWAEWPLATCPPTSLSFSTRFKAK